MNDHPIQPFHHPIMTPVVAGIVCGCSYGGSSYIETSSGRPSHLQQAPTSFRDRFHNRYFWASSTHFCLDLRPLVHLVINHRPCDLPMFFSLVNHRLPFIAISSSYAVSRSCSCPYLAIMGGMGCCQGLPKHGFSRALPALRRCSAYRTKPSGYP